jgi:periplasmic protein TonB
MFEPHRSREAETLMGSRSRFFPVSLAIHGAGLLAVLGASLWSVDEPPDPPVPIKWVSPSPPAPAAARRSRTAEPLRPAAKGRAERNAVVAPTDVPDRLPVAASLPESAERFEPGSGDAGEPSNGDGDGDVHGLEGGTGRARGDPGSGDQILRPGGDVHPPVLVRRVEPVYPEAARKARLEGDVMLEAIITSRGEIEEVRVVKSGGLFLDASARDAVERWKYRPATLNGRAVRVLLTVTINFRLH